MGEQPTVWGRVFALVHGEVSSDTLEAYRRAGNAVYDLLKQVEDQRLALKVQGVHPWKVEAATQVEFLCAWNAFALQTLGDEFLDADSRASPATVGYVPPVTARQVHTFYSQVEEWLSRARQAQSNPAYQLDVDVPADLPPWAEVEPCPGPHLDAMLAATRALRTHAEGAMAVFEVAGTPQERQNTVQQLRQLLADASTKAEYAQGLWGRDVPQELHEQIERHVKVALEEYYHLGQYLAVPRLLDRPQPRADRPASAIAHERRRPPGPGEPGFDPWCLTDPATHDAWKRDPQACETIALLWQYDPDPQRTLGLQEQIDAAYARGDLADATNRAGQRLGHDYCCPWAAIYVVRRPVTIGGRRLGTLQQFTLDVSAEGALKGEEFKREILVANFQPTTRIDYCNPREGGHDE